MVLVLLTVTLSYGSLGISVDSTPMDVSAPAESRGPIYIDGNGDLLSQKASNSWNGSGAEGDPVVIADYYIESDIDCILIVNVTLYFRIESCELTTNSTYGGNGISVVDSENGHILDCYIHMRHFGIFVDGSDHISIERVTTHDCIGGVFVIDSAFVSVVHNNLGWNDYTGLVLNLTTHAYCYDNSIVGNWDIGIDLKNDTNTHMRDNVIASCRIGIQSIFSENLVIENLTAYDCQDGIDVHAGWNIFILGSYIHNCSHYGIFLGSWTSNISVVLNTFGPNNEHGNAYDDGEGNSWDDTYSQIGNNWSDYSGSGYYYIPGSAGSVDHYPFGFQTSTTITTTTTTPTTTTTTSETSTTTTSETSTSEPATTNTTSSTISSTTGNNTTFAFPSEITLLISLGSMIVILIVVIAIIKDKG